MRFKLTMVAKALIACAVFGTGLGALAYSDGLQLSDVGGLLGVIAGSIGGLIGSFLGVDMCRSPRRTIIALYSVAGSIACMALGSIGLLPLSVFLLSGAAPATIADFVGMLVQVGIFCAVCVAVPGAVIGEPSWHHHRVRSCA